LAALEAAYARGETDEFVEPTLIGRWQDHLIEDDDVVIFGNFRADRARELTSALALDEFDGFERAKQPRLARFI
jgi:2,3-bisphosphoglycerate-independent phosphoglycerate mutase